MEVPPMTDILRRLRDADISGHGSYSALVREAADEIERLRAVDASELGRLRADNLRLVEIIARNETHYQAAMAMSEKHRKLWVEACQERERIRAELQSVIKEQSDGR
jgi:hypothetical protein